MLLPLLMLFALIWLIVLIKWLIVKARRGKWEDVEPTASPLTPGIASKYGRDGVIEWNAETFGGSWNLTILNEKERPFQRYELNNIPKWKDVVEARSKIVEEIKRLEKGERWEVIEPPTSIMKNKSVKFSGQIAGYTHYEVFNDSGVWRLRILKAGFTRTALIDSAEAETWQEIIQMKDLWVKQERLQVNRETEPRTLKKSEPKKLKELEKLERKK